MNARNEAAGIQEYSDEHVGITAKCVCEGHVNRDANPRTNDSGPVKTAEKRDVYLRGETGSSTSPAFSRSVCEFAGNEPTSELPPRPEPQSERILRLQCKPEHCMSLPATRDGPASLKMRCCRPFRPDECGLRTSPRETRSFLLGAQEPGGWQIAVRGQLRNRDEYPSPPLPPGRRNTIRWALSESRSAALLAARPTEG